jgi:hypothetical protein
MKEGPHIFRAILCPIAGWITYTLTSMEDLVE